MSVQDLFQGEPALVPGSLRGYRCWDGPTKAGQLRSTGMRHVWEPAPHDGRSEHALCLISTTDHAAPQPDCSCGLYGWYDPADSRLVLSQVFGAVQATGRVVLGSHGFRAERLEVLAVTAENPHVLSSLRAAGYPTVPTREELLERWPADDVSGLVEHRCDARCYAQGGMGSGAFLLASLGLSSAAAAAGAHRVVAQLQQAMATSAETLLASLEALAAAADGDTDPPAPPLSLRERALAAVRRRGTGPRARLRAPKTLGVGGKP